MLMTVRARRFHAVALLAAAGLVAAAQEPPPSPVLGAPAAFDRQAVEQQHLRLAAGTAIHQAAARRTPLIARLEAATELPVVDRRGPWAQVRYRGRLGWVLVDEAALDRSLPAAPSLPAVLRPPPVAAERLDAARRHLGPQRSSRTVAGYVLESDADDAALLDRLARLLGRLDAAFAARSGLTPPPPNGELIAVFARRDAYLAFAAADPQLPQVEVVGHASGGVAALAAEGRPPRHLESLLAHEVAHLIIRRTLGLNLPPWLEEGLAEDLAYCRIDDDGTPLLGSVNDLPPVRLAARTFAVADGAVFFAERRAGGRAALRELRAGLRRLPSLAELTALDAAAFVGDGRRLHYAAGGFLVRYLLDGGDPRLAAGFRAFLAAVASGDEAGGAALAKRLGRDLPALDRGFRRWLREGPG